MYYYGQEGRDILQAIALLTLLICFIINIIGTIVSVVYSHFENLIHHFALASCSLYFMHQIYIGSPSLFSILICLSISLLSVLRSSYIIHKEFKK